MRKEGDFKMNLQFVIDVVIVVACYHLFLNAVKCLLNALLGKVADDVNNKKD